MLVLDFAKAFDTVPHQRLLKKLAAYGVTGNLHINLSAILITVISADDYTVTTNFFVTFWDPRLKIFYYKKLNLVPWIREHPYIQIRVVWNMPD